LNYALFPPTGDDGDLIFELEQIYKENIEGQEANLDDNSKDGDQVDKGMTLHVRLLWE
jgi:hypothetical protein